MLSKMMSLFPLLISMLLISCGPKLPDTAEVQQIVETYLQEKIPSMVRVDSLKTTKIEKKSNGCTVHFQGVFIPADTAKTNIARPMLGAMFKKSSFLEQRVMSIENQETLKAFMILEYADGKWGISKHVPSILIPES